MLLPYTGHSHAHTSHSTHNWIEGFFVFPLYCCQHKEKTEKGTWLFKRSHGAVSQEKALEPDDDLKVLELGKQAVTS